MTINKRNWFVLLWLVGAGVATFLYYRWQVEADLVGIVETRVHRVGAREGGRVENLLVEIGDRVQEGQALARLDMSDLLAEKARLRDEMKSLDVIMEADRRRYALEYDRGRLQVEYRNAWLEEKTADLAARKAELAAMDAEIQRLRSAEKDGLGRTRDLADLVIRRNALARYLDVSSRRQDAGVKETPKTDLGAADQEKVLRSLTADRRERVEEIRLQLVRLDQRIRMREVRSPVQGYVVDILARQGDTLPAYAPIVAVEEEQASAVDVYLPETEEAPAAVGQLVEIVSKRGREFDARGRVVFIYPGYMPIPERLMFRRQMAWALKMRVALEHGHRLRPGESVNVRVLDGVALAAEPSVATLDSVEGKSPKKGGPMPMKVPGELRSKTRFEPSGIVWLDDIHRFLVVSDDTGLKGMENHAPWVFLMTTRGEVEPDPLTIEGLKSINDLESVTMADDGTLFLVASQSVNRKGKRPLNRRLLVRVSRKGRHLKAKGIVPLLQTVREAFEAQGKTKTALGLDNAGLAALDIEGAAWKDGALYFGLKQPISPEGALIWKLDRLDALFAKAPFRPGDLTLYARVDLGAFKGRKAGFSDLFFGADGAMYALATIPDVDDGEQQGTFLRIERADGGKWIARDLMRFAGLKPEGLYPAPSGGFMIVFDEGSDNPLYLHTEIQ
ncbi:MAG: HlyD family efflux transporter periplasmic adaptor subunit [Deltaproteobacteria bacterium]|nr:HlyD family efflux transporter periplasmic adaptor subunit [Deltaproteobacteria bacterium]